MNAQRRKIDVCFVIGNDSCSAFDFKERSTTKASVSMFKRLRLLRCFVLANQSHIVTFTSERHLTCFSFQTPSLSKRRQRSTTSAQLTDKQAVDGGAYLARNRLTACLLVYSVAGPIGLQSRVVLRSRARTRPGAQVCQPNSNLELLNFGSGVY